MLRLNIKQIRNPLGGGDTPLKIVQEATENSVDLITSGAVQAICNNRLKSNGGVARNLLIYQSPSKGGKALCSRLADSKTLADLFDELRYLNGGMGSCVISGISPMPTNESWYNYIYIPHRCGGIDGAADADNCNYGTLLLFPMNCSTGTWYRAQYIRGSISVHAQS